MRVIAFITLLFAAQAYADIYQCIDDRGHIIFQPGPCEPGSQSEKKIEVGNLLKKQNRITDPHTENTILNKNLLLNPAFENAQQGWSLPADTQQVEGKGVNGSAALQMAAREPPQDKYIHETVVSQCVQIKNGAKFSLGGRFRHEGRAKKTNANRIRVTWYESLDCSRGGQFGWFAEPKDVTGWQSPRYDNLKPALNARSAKIEIMQNGRYSNRAKAYWDNVFFMATELSPAPAREARYVLPAGFDFIENGDFRRNVSAWHKGWTISWVGYTGHHGVGAAKVSTSSGKSSIGKEALSQCVEFGSANQRFDVGASFKNADISTQTGGARLRVAWYAEANCRGRAKIDPRSSDPDKNSKGWQTLRIDGIQAAPGSTSARLQLIQSIDGPGSYHAYWDDVYFKVAK